MDGALGHWFKHIWQKPMLTRDEQNDGAGKVNLGIVSAKLSVKINHQGQSSRIHAIFLALILLALS